MAGKATFYELGFVQLNADFKSPLFRQLYDSIRTAILDGVLTPNSRIPSSRDLMVQLGVSRTTIVTAIDLLIAEGYLQTIAGSGTFVSNELPDDRPFINSAPIKLRASTAALALPKSSRRNPGREKSQASPTDAFPISPKAFRLAVPALDEFPRAIWSKITRRIWNTLSPSKLSYGNPAGYFPLRQSIAEYLRINRGVRCETEQVMIVSGTQQAIDVVAKITLNDGDKVLYENPGYVNGREALIQHGAQIVPVTVNENGTMTDQATKQCPEAKLIYVTPSHQYPVGPTLPIERRLELINWAGKTNGLILEDDYDSEYRYSQKPIPSLQGLDLSNRTIYVGSFSKVIFPALGIGYAVVPPKMVQEFEHALRLASRPVSFVDQVILNEFISEGHFGRHLRRMRKTYAIRRQTFVDEVQKQLSDSLTIVGSPAGLHCAAILKTGEQDTVVSERLAEAGIVTRPLAYYYQKGTPKTKRLNGLVFGFACVSPAQIKSGLRKIAEVI